MQKMMSHSLQHNEALNLILSGSLSNKLTLVSMDFIFDLLAKV